VRGAAGFANDITWWENDGEQNFTEHTIAANFDGANSVYAADIDSDGDMDVLGAAWGADEITWWESDLDQELADESGIIPVEFGLEPAYPNPFNSTTTISYVLPYPSQVSLQIYNLSGQRITTLFDGYRQAGIYTTNLYANDLPSGLYFVRLEASEKVATQKVMLIR